MTDADPLAGLLAERDRYRDALVTIQNAAAWTADSGTTDVAVLVGDDGNLDWSAVHTFVTDVVDLDMTPDAALADLADDPAGVQDAIERDPWGAIQRPATLPGVPDQPQGE